MIDYRLFTFMDLHETMNYTKTAMNLNITQPAVTQHIKHLEAAYHVKLFNYERKRLTLTKEGEYLYEHALALLANAHKLQTDIVHIKDECEKIHLGASLTIGEYLAPSFILALYKEKPKIELTMTIENTEVLLEDIRLGNINFAFVEGLFNKEEFYTRLIRKEEMVLIMSKDHPLASRSQLRIEDLLHYRMIVREPGSGTRDIFIQALQQLNLSLHNFEQHMEVNHINTIKKLVEGNLGVSFLYESAVHKELQEGKLVSKKVKGFRLMREFNMVALKDSIYRKQYDEYYQLFCDHISE